RHLHVDVVNHDAEVVRRYTIRAQQYQVVELAVRKFDRPLDEVVPADAALLRCTKADHRRAILRRNEAGRARALRTPPSVIARLEALRTLRSAQLVDLFLRRPARISVALRDQLVSGLL